MLGIFVRVLYNRAVGEDTAKSSSYREIAAELALEIESGAVAAGAFLPTEKDLQTRFGASRTTIRRAFSKLIEDGLAESVPNRGVIARKQGNGQKSIAFIDGNTIVLRRIYSRLSSLFLKKGYHLVHIDSESVGLENSLHFAMDRGFEGAFVWSFQGFCDLSVVQAVTNKLPLVILDHSIPGLSADLVTLNYLDMSSEITKHLVSAGRKKIAISGMLDMLDSTHDRLSGYLRGLFESGQRPTPRDFVFCHTSALPNSDPLLLERRLRDEDRPDAVFVMQDEFALPVVETISKVGLRIPEDVAIATIGDDVQISVGGIGLTAVHCEWDEFADLAYGAMLERISGSTVPPRRLVASHKVVVRGSCGSAETVSSGADEPVVAVARQ